MKAELKQILTIHFENPDEEKEAERLSGQYQKQGFEQKKITRTVGSDSGHIVLEANETFIHKKLK